MTPENNPLSVNNQVPPIIKKKNNANVVYILIGLAVLVVFAAMIIVSVMKRNPMNDALLPEPSLEDRTSQNNPSLNQGVFVERIDVMTMESFPVQVNALVRGNLADGCTSIADTSVRRDTQTFYIDFVTAQKGDMCTQALVPFEKSVALPVGGLKAGTYTVSVAGTTTTFRMAVDNAPTAVSDK